MDLTRSELRVLNFILRRMPPHRARDVAGDLEEEWSLRARTNSHLKLRIWFWRQLIAFAWWLTVENFTDRNMKLETTRSRGGGFMAGVWQDLRFAVRSFTRAPGFTLTTVITLALGIGAVTAIFTVVNTVLWRQLDIPDANRVVGVCDIGGSMPGDFCGGSPPNMTDWSRMSNTLEGFGIARSWSLQLPGDDGVEIVNTAIATPEFLKILGARTILGRLFTDEDLPPNNRFVAVLTHAYWITRFGADSNIVGRLIPFDDGSYEVIGVLAPYPEPPILGRAKLWRPLIWSPTDEENRDWRGFYSIARIKEGVTFGEAQTEMTALAAGLAEAYPEANKGNTVRLVSLRDQLVGWIRPQMLIFFGASVLVLLIAVVNVANLFLTRASDRQKEFAVRASLGAGWSRIVRQLVTESALLGLLGVGLGIWMGQIGVKVFVSLAPAGVPRLDQVGLDGTVLGFTIMLLVGTAVIFGLAPAMQTRGGGVDTSQSLKQGGLRRSSGSKFGTRGALVISEVALATTLVIGAGLLMNSFLTASHWDLGFQRENLGVVWLLGSETKHENGQSVVGSFEEITREVASLPQVTNVALASAGPLFGGEEHGEFTVAGQPDPGPNLRPRIRWFDVNANYFNTMGTAIVRGRGFDTGERAGSPAVVVLNEQAARMLFGEDDPIGRQIVDVDLGQETMEVVGVVKNFLPRAPDEIPEAHVYWPNTQRPRLASYLVFRTSTDVTSTFETVKRRIVNADASVSMGSFTTMDTLMGLSLVRPRFQMLLIGVFASVALALAVVGTYGVISYNVSGRTHEFGLRMSLGARQETIVRLVLKQGATLGVIGLALGLMGAAATTHFLSSILIGVNPRDPIVFGSTALVLGLVIVLAGYLPARRASRVDPMVALRSE